LTGILTKKGFTMVDTVMAMCFVMIGVVAMLSIFPQSWALSGTSDMRSRAASVLYRELERDEQLIMNPCNQIVIGDIAAVSVYSSDYSTSKAGDRRLTVTKNIANAGANVWQITVTVAWAGSSVQATRNVTRQDSFRFPTTCADNSKTDVVY
jgi:Tfp pilus assembly protein PilV